MAITGKFEADFQSFFSAVATAEAKLTDFQSGAGRVETSLNRMVDSFSGRKIIQEATLAAEAIKRLDGPANVVESELQRIAAKAVEAVAQLKRMGVEVPPGIQALANQLKPVDDNLGFIGNSAKDLVGRLVAVFAIERVVAFALEVGKAQQQLQRLSKETQIDVEELQTLSAATRAYGIDNDTLGRALFNVSRAIAGGDASVARGLHMVGLSIDDVKNKHGKELFLDIERGLATLNGSFRDTAAADIWGARLGASLAGFSNEADDAVAKAEKLNIKLSKDSVQAMAEYADAVERTQARLTNIKDTMVGPLAQGFNTLNEANEKGASWWNISKAVILDWGNSIVTGHRSGTALAFLLDDLNRKQEQAAAGSQAESDARQQLAGSVSAESAARNFLYQLQRDAAKELAPYQVQALQDLKAIGQLNAENAAAVGVGVDQFKKYTAEVTAAEAATKKLTEETKRAEAEILKVEADVANAAIHNSGTRTEIELADIARRENEAIASLHRLGQDTDENVAKVRGSFAKLRDQVGIDWETIRQSSMRSLQDTADRALKTYQAMLADVNIPREALDRQLQVVRDTAAAATAMGQQMSDAEEKARKKTDETTEALKRQKEERERIRKEIEAMVSTIEYDLSTKEGMEKFKQLNPNATVNADMEYFKKHTIEEAVRAGLIDFYGGMYPVQRMPGFANGVVNFQGGTAMVGERGPEIVELPKGSNVIPMSGARAAYVKVDMFVNGVFDPATKMQMTEMFSSEIEKILHLNRPLFGS